jgi:hypothetical protein
MDQKARGDLAYHRSFSGADDWRNHFNGSFAHLKNCKPGGWINTPGNTKKAVKAAVSNERRPLARKNRNLLWARKLV